MRQYSLAILVSFFRIAWATPFWTKSTVLGQCLNYCSQLSRLISGGKKYASEFQISFDSVFFSITYCFDQLPVFCLSHILRISHMEFDPPFTMKHVPSYSFRDCISTTSSINSLSTVSMSQRPMTRYRKFTRSKCFFFAVAQGITVAGSITRKWESFATRTHQTKESVIMQSSCLLWRQCHSSHRRRKLLDHTSPIHMHKQIATLFHVWSHLVSSSNLHTHIIVAWPFLYLSNRICYLSMFAAHSMW